MSHQQVAEEFAHGATKGQGSRMFIEGDTIYSYGHHFPIAKRYKGGYVFTEDGYSSSTNHHKSIVQQAIHYGILWYAPGCNELRIVEGAAATLEHNLNRIPQSRSLFSHYVQGARQAVSVAQIASESLGLSMAPMYKVMATEKATQAIKKISRKAPEELELIYLYGKAQFLANRKGTVLADL